MIVFRNCTLVPELTEGFTGTKADLYVKDGRIQGIYAPDCGPEAGEDACTVDIAGKTVLPGFFDLHTHLYFSTENLDVLAHRSIPDTVMDCVDSAVDKVRYGYTTIRDCGGSDQTVFAVRDAIRKGIIQGPRVIAPGRCITPTTKGNDAFGALYCEFDDPAQARRVVRKELELGAEFIKYMATGAGLNPGGEPGALITTREELSALVQAAEENNTYVAAHCHGKRGIMLCIECGVKTIEHASMIDEECIEAIKHSGRDVALIPTLAIVYAFTTGLVQGVPQSVIDNVHETGTYSVKALRKAFDAGITMGWGTDVDKECFDMNPFLEFQARRDMGLTNLDMLRQLTIESARIIGYDDRLGTIKAGKLADLVVMNGDPVRDYDALASKPVMVFKEGELIH
ncbi:MAG: amidohydrolase family protein [Mogibacterium sp.]|nr:amidohydrolase family protein [Mogibacterium sp.]